MSSHVLPGSTRQKPVEVQHETSVICLTRTFPDILDMYVRVLFAVSTGYKTKQHTMLGTKCFSLEQAQA